MELHQDWIKERAYAIWEEEGRPQGRDRDHWDRAAQEFVAKVPEQTSSTARSAPVPKKKRAGALKAKSRRLQPA